MTEVRYSAIVSDNRDQMVIKVMTEVSHVECSKRCTAGSYNRCFILLGHARIQRYKRPSQSKLRPEVKRGHDKRWRSQRFEKISDVNKIMSVVTRVTKEINKVRGEVKVH
jgi:hypothetical protein